MYPKLTDEDGFLHHLVVSVTGLYQGDALYEDALQEARFETAIVRHKFDPNRPGGTTWKSFLAIYVRSRLKRWIRKERRKGLTFVWDRSVKGRRRQIKFQPITEDISASSPLHDWQEVVEQIRRIVATLPAKERLVCELILNGEPLRQIARRQGITLSTLQYRIGKLGYGKGAFASFA